MKIALCLFGHIGGMKSKGGSLHGDVDVSRAYSSYKKMILMIMMLMYLFIAGALIVRKNL